MFCLARALPHVPLSRSRGKEIDSVQSFITCEFVNRLIVVGRENVLVLDEAALFTDDPVRQGRLREQSNSHSLMLHELEGYIARIGGVAISKASFRARVRAFWRKLRGLFGRQRGQQTITACLKAEVSTEAAYAAALALKLSPASRCDLEQQSYEISAYRKYLKGLA